MSDQKVYRAGARLGVSTDTYDREGEIVEQGDYQQVSREQVEDALQRMVGPLDQIPPMYSAIKHKGTPLYRLARRGETIEREPRRVVIHAAKLLEWNPPHFEITVRCSKGTYIRSLAHDLGQQLGCGAHLTSLTRLASGPFRLADALSLETVQAAAEREALRSLLLPMDSALQGFPAVEVDSHLAKKIQFGQRVELPDAPQGTLIRAYEPDGRLLALLRFRHDSQWQPHKVFLHPESHESHPRSS